MRTALVGWLVACVLAVVVPEPLLAHGRLKGSSPGADAHLAQVPAQLRLDFSEAAELAFTAVRLFASDGREITLGPLALAPGSRRSVILPITGLMDAGPYEVRWQVAGNDGHPVRGRFGFVIAPGAVGVRTTAGPMPEMHHDPVSMPESTRFGAESPTYVVLRWLQFTSILLIIGSVAFRVVVLRTMERAGAEPAFVVDAARLAARAGFVAVLALAATLVVRLFAQSFAMHGAENSLDLRLVSGMLRNTMWGWGWLLQLAGLLLAGVAFRSSRWWLAACGAVAIAFSPALSGHAASTPDYRGIAIVSDGLHIMSASAWLGTLTMVLIAGLAATARQSSAARGPLVRSLVLAFSPLALASAGLAAATGVFAAWLHVNTWQNLWSTPYGITLLIKLGILGVVALTGFFNWRVVQPKLGADGATAQLARSARVEVAVAILVLLVTAILVASPTSMDAVM